MEGLPQRAARDIYWGRVVGVSGSYSRSFPTKLGGGWGGRSESEEAAVWGPSFVQEGGEGWAG